MVANELCGRHRCTAISGPCAGESAHHGCHIDGGGVDDEREQQLEASQDVGAQAAVAESTLYDAGYRD